ncbi:MAG: ACP S-malonyltransferase [Endomicrobiales bacterium]
MRYGLLFPGQGSQNVGMGKDLYESFPIARDIIDRANDVLGFDLKKIIFDGPEELLKQTQYTQPAIFTVSIAAFNVFSSLVGLVPGDCIAAGHSLGEYSALCAAGVFSFDEGLKLVKSRGEFIQKASVSHPGTMAAIIGLDSEKVKGICQRAAQDGTVCEPVNFNSPGQIVIAGHKAAIDRAVALATAEGAMKAIELNVSGPFHSSLMTDAAVMMREELTHYAFVSPSFPVVTNCDAHSTSTGSDVPEKLVKQINGPVYWDESVKMMVNAGASTCIEIGPGRVLSGLMRRINKSIKCVNIEDKKSLDAAVTTLTQNKETASCN